MVIVDEVLPCRRLLAVGAAWPGGRWEDGPNSGTRLLERVSDRASRLTVTETAGLAAYPTSRGAVFEALADPTRRFVIQTPAAFPSRGGPTCSPSSRSPPSRCGR